MHASVRANDKADFDFLACSSRNKHWIRRGQSLRWPRVFAARAGTHVRDVAELGSALGILPDLVFALNQDGLARAWRRNLQGGHAGGGKCEYQEPRPDAKHA